MAQMANQNSLNFALDDEVSGQFQPATALSAVPIDRRLVSSQSQSGRRDGEYAMSKWSTLPGIELQSVSLYPVTSLTELS